MNAAFCEHRVRPRYPVTGDWRAATGWELTEGRYQRLYRSRENRGRVRYAFVERHAGGWRWSVIERRARGGRLLVGRSAADVTYVLAYNAFNPAEVSAQTR